MSLHKKSNWYVGVTLTGVLLLIAGIGLVWTPFNPTEMSILLKLSPPTLLHPFGTDHFGRDILSRVMGGMANTFLIAGLTVFMGTIIGTFIGAITGYFGGWLDEAIMRINDALTAFPSILLALVFVSIVGSGKYNIILALGILFIPSFARIMRSEYVTQKQMDYVKNAKVMGATNIRIMYKHILPNTMTTLLPAVAIGFNNAVLAEAGMSYLGLGVQPPEASLGRMLAESQTYLFTAPWFAIAPGIVIICIVLGFSFLSEK